MFNKFTNVFTNLFSKDVKEIVPEITKTYFQNFLDNNRDYQTASLEEVVKNDRGIICLPCGTGKTRIQSSIIVKGMFDCIESNTYGVFVIASHRLALNNQLCDNIVNLAVKSGFEFDVVLLHSDRADDDKFYGKYYKSNVTRHTHRFNSTTQSDELQKYIQDASEEKRNVLIVATYNSLDKLSIIPKINILTCDEAHNLVGNNDEKQFMANFLAVNDIIEKVYFFTATLKTSGLHHGMYNKERFGNVIFKVSPREMIERREIVAPTFQIIDIEGEDKGGLDNNLMTVKAIIQSFNFHKNKIKSDSSNPDSIGAKLMVTCSGNTQLSGIIENEDFIEFCSENKITMMSFSSTFGYYCNFNETSRDELISRMNNIEDSSDSIILHMDILTEGIDLPAITGVMLLRGLGKIKLIQNIGRACRLTKDDRKLVYSGNTNLSEFIKPYCHILLPTFIDNLGDYFEIKDTIREVINEYDIPIEEFTTKESFTSKLNGELLDSITGDYVNKVSTKEANIVNIVEDIYVEKAMILTTVEKTEKMFSRFFRKK